MRSAIRLAAQAFAKAYNAGNAKAIAQLFAADGEIVNEEGESTRGRAAIEGAFAGIFKEHPKTHIDLVSESIRFPSPNMAVEDGTATVTYGVDEPAQHSPYSVVYTREDGKWLTATRGTFPMNRQRPRNNSSSSSG